MWARDRVAVRVRVIDSLAGYMAVNSIIYGKFQIYIDLVDSVMATSPAQPLIV